MCHLEMCAFFRPRRSVGELASLRGCWLRRSVCEVCQREVVRLGDLAQIVVHHHGYQLLERHPGTPSQIARGLTGVSDQHIHLGWAHVTLICRDIPLPILDTNVGE